MNHNGPINHGRTPIDIAHYIGSDGNEKILRLVDAPKTKEEVEKIYQDSLRMKAYVEQIKAQNQGSKHDLKKERNVEQRPLKTETSSGPKKTSDYHQHMTTTVSSTIKTYSSTDRSNKMAIGHFDDHIEIPIPPRFAHDDVQNLVTASVFANAILRLPAFSNNEEIKKFYLENLANTSVGPVTLDGGPCRTDSPIDGLKFFDMEPLKTYLENHPNSSDTIDFSPICKHRDNTNIWKEIFDLIPNTHFTKYIFTQKFSNHELELLAESLKEVKKGHITVVLTADGAAEKVENMIKTGKIIKKKNPHVTVTHIGRPTHYQF